VPWSPRAPVPSLAVDIAVFTFAPKTIHMLSPVAAQHSLPSGRYSLLGPDFRRLDRTSLRLARSPNVRADQIKILRILSLSETYALKYWWCSPPRTGIPNVRPTVWTARGIGASSCSDKCVRASL